MVILTIIFVAVVLFRMAKVIYNITRYLYIRNFYVNALKIATVSCLPSLGWKLSHIFDFVC